MIASTDFDANQTEMRYIKAVGGPTASGSYLIELDAPLTYGHWGEEVPTATEGVHFVQVTHAYAVNLAIHDRRTRVCLNRMHDDTSPL